MDLKEKLKINQLQISMYLFDTFSQLKTQISKDYENWVFFFNDLRIDDAKTLADYEIESGSCLQLENLTVNQVIVDIPGK